MFSPGACNFVSNHYFVSFGACAYPSVVAWIGVRVCPLAVVELLGFDHARDFSGRDVVRALPYHRSRRRHRSSLNHNLGRKGRAGQGKGQGMKNAKLVSLWA